MQYRYENYVSYSSSSKTQDITKKTSKEGAGTEIFFKSVLTDYFQVFVLYVNTYDIILLTNTS